MSWKGVAVTVMGVGVILAAAWFILFSGTGLQLVIYTGEKLTGGKLKVESATGRLADGFEVRGVTYSTTDRSVVVQRFSLSWNLLSLYRRHVHLENVLVEGVSYIDRTTSDSKEESGGVALPELSFPLSLQFDVLEIVDAIIINNNSPATRIKRLKAKVNLGRDEINLSALELSAGPVQCQIKGRLKTVAEWDVDMQGQCRYQPPGKPEIAGSFSLSETLEKGRLVLETELPVKGTITTLFSLGDQLRWQSKMTVGGFDPALYFPEYPGSLDAQAILSGSLDGDTLSADLALESLTGEIRSYPIEAKGSIHSDGSSIAVKEMRLKSRSSLLHMKGVAGANCDLDLEFSSAGIEDLLPGVSGVFQAKGKVHGSVNNLSFNLIGEGENLKISDASAKDVTLSLSGQASLPGEMKGEVVVNGVTYGGQVVETLSLEISGDRDSHNIDVHLKKNQLTGFIRFNGALIDEEWRGKVSLLNIASSDKGTLKLGKPARLVVSASGAELKELCLSHESTRVCFGGFLNQQGWQGELNLVRLNPGFFLSEWPGVVDAMILGKGDFGGESMSASVELAKLSGRIKEHPVQGSGTAQYSTQSISWDNLIFKYGEASLTIDGVLGPDSSLLFQGKIPDFGAISSDYEGQFFFQGSLAGAKDAPVIDVEFDAHNIKIGGAEVAAVEGSVDIDLQSGPKIDGAIRVSDAHLNDVALYTGALLVNGGEGNHVFTLDLSSSAGTASFQGRAKYDERWQAHLQSATITATRLGDFVLLDPAELTLSAEGWGVENLCLGGESGEGCISANRTGSEGWQVEGKIDRFLLSKLHEQKLVTLPLRGTLKGEISGGKIPGGKTELVIQVDSEEISVEGEVAGEERSYHFFNTDVNVNLNESSVALGISSQLGDGGSVKGKLQTTEGAETLDQVLLLPITGSFVANIEDTSFISLLTYSTLEPTGQLTADLILNGTVGSPRAIGELSFENGGVNIVDYGIELKDIVVEMAAQEQQVDFSLTANSGPGQAKAIGKFSTAEQQQWEFVTTVIGENFEVLSTDEYLFRVNSAIDFSCDKNGGRLSGKVEVPFARITLLNEEGRVTPSEDVVIVDESWGEEKSTWQMATHLDVILGDDVKVDAYGVESSLVGSLSLVDEPGKTLSVEGELDVKDGVFALYSTELDITRGRILFAGGAVDNPGVDFRAQRIVDDKTVGVDVGGSVQNLEFQLFSDPVMEESNILAYMVVGRSMYAAKDNQQSIIGAAATAIGLHGVNEVTSKLGEYLPIDEIYLDGSSTSEDMSIVLGKHITEDLFVGYNHDFFDQEGEFQISYNLGKGFSIQTNSSVNSTSGDILYSIER